MKIALCNASVISDGATKNVDILIDGEWIIKVGNLSEEDLRDSQALNFEGKIIVPGAIDDQVHFREPGLTQKGCIESESKAALAGGVTSFMEMPNTNPQTTDLKNLSDKFEIAKNDSWGNYSFYLGATNDNIDIIEKLDINDACGIKVFMGSSTGNMLVDDINVLSKIFAKRGLPIAIHSEDEETIQTNMKKFKDEYGEDAPPSVHPKIRNNEACYKSTIKAIGIAEKSGGHLHILHLSTAEEVELIAEAKAKGINVTAEVCVHHLVFDDRDYESRGNFIKWNPSVKSEKDKLALIEGLKNDTIDIVATDHAPHEFGKKSLSYFNAPSGGPLVQHSLPLMLDLADKGIFTKEFVIEKMCHKPAELFKVKDRGYIKAGYKADLVVIDPNNPVTISKENIHYKCGWSPFEGTTLNHKINTVFVNGKVAFNKGNFLGKFSQPLEFNR